MLPGFGAWLSAGVVGIDAACVVRRSMSTLSVPKADGVSSVRRQMRIFGDEISLFSGLTAEAVGVASARIAS